MSDRILLTEHEKAHPIWAKVQDHLALRLERLRQENDGDADERKTARCRGAIQEIKTLIALGRETPNL